MSANLNRSRGCLLGLAVGDAVGTTVEFMRRGSFAPVTDMIGGGPFRLQPGQWTDDTSMALCLATSLASQNALDPVDQMNRYVSWYRNGYLSSTGHCFDIGGTVRQALEEYEHTGNPFSGSTDPYSAGNGSIMRLAPIPLFYFPDLEQIIYYAGESSRTTHGALECIEACQLFAEMVFRALSGMSKDDILIESTVKLVSPKIVEIARGEYRHKSITQIEGSGYVVKCLEAALWCFYQTDTFESAILEAVNLGDDADTTAAVCGQIAGAFYGEASIPASWLEKLFMRAQITDLADTLSNWKQP
ncbi:MAG TPA: ADP-ribosylglycohydrolase family protein [Anaerolineales bacterium]|nr:ADP-ribosylglycohydrolase family protein [Anaerolineales bacterium]